MAMKKSLVHDIHGSYRRFCGINSLTLAAELSLHLAEVSPCRSRERRVTRLESSIKSTIRKSARPCPITTSGSGATASVHCDGTEQTVLSSTRSNRRLPDRLYRSPTQTSCRPPNGWNGCVIRTSCVETAEKPAFRGELQAAGARPVHLADPGRRSGGDQRRPARLSARRDRLAQPATHLAADLGRVTATR
jgi:hypothetical protein